MGGRVRLLLLLIELAVFAAVLAQTPPGAGSIPLGQQAFCVGNPNVNSGETTGQGTVAVFADVRGWNYDNSRNVLWVGSYQRLYRVDSTCTMSVAAGAIYSAGASTGPLNTPQGPNDVNFWYIKALAAVDNFGPIVLADGTCKLRKFIPETGYTYPFGGYEVGGLAGTGGGPYAGCDPVNGGQFVSGNTVGFAPSDLKKVGNAQGIAYHPLDKRIYVVWADNSIAYSEIWSIRVSDESDVKVVATLSASGSQGFQHAVPDPSSLTLYACTMNRQIYRIDLTTYAKTLIVTVPHVNAGAEMARFAIASNNVGDLRIVAAGVVGPGGGESPVYVYDRNGNQLASFTAPAAICPGVAASNDWSSCATNGVGGSTYDGRVFVRWASPSGLSWYIYRALDPFFGMKVLNGASVLLSGGQIIMGT